MNLTPHEIKQLPRWKGKLVPLFHDKLCFLIMSSYFCVNPLAFPLLVLPSSVFFMHILHVTVALSSWKNSRQSSSSPGSMRWHKHSVVLTTGMTLVAPAASHHLDRSRVHLPYVACPHPHPSWKAWMDIEYFETKWLPLVAFSWLDCSLSESCALGWTRSCLSFCCLVEMSQLSKGMLTGCQFCLLYEASIRLLFCCLEASPAGTVSHLFFTLFTAGSCRNGGW